MARKRRTDPDQERPAARPVFTDRDLSDFLLRACHDLRTPVRAIRAHTELFLRGGEPALSASAAERLGFVTDGARKIDLLVDAISSYSIALRIDPAAFQPTPLGFVLRTALSKLDKVLKACGAEVTHGELPRVLGNADRLIELFGHLLRNALEHRGESPPSVRVTAEDQGREWLLSVHDNGPGVEAEYLERIFQPFEHGESSYREGAGMGLAICRLIVERHGGTLRAESKPGEGATFLFTLPAGG